ncbi:DUF6101 family protein [Roseibium sp.]|uniref:DUF6101 family protein n=1 Tax=Roseibium sp. TaxID=1936156 RepID=UPI003A9866DC
MGSQTAIDRADIGSGTFSVPDPGQLPARFHSRLFNERSSAPGTDEPVVDVQLDKTNVCLTQFHNGAPTSLIAPVQSYAGIMVQITPSERPGAVNARLILKHSDPQFSVLLTETDRPEQLATAWPSWSSALGLPMLVCDTGGTVKPIEAFSARPTHDPHPRRKLPLLTGRRPRFLVRRACGSADQTAPVFSGEREIIARS